MTVKVKASVKALFEDGDEPTGADFADLIDSYQDVSFGGSVITTIASGATGLIDIESSASSTTRSLGTFGQVFISTNTTAEATDLLSTVSAGAGPGAAIVSADTTAKSKALLNITSGATTAEISAEREMLGLGYVLLAATAISTSSQQIQVGSAGVFTGEYHKHILHITQMLPVAACASPQMTFNGQSTNSYSYVSRGHTNESIERHAAGPGNSNLNIILASALQGASAPTSEFANFAITIPHASSARPHTAYWDGTVSDSGASIGMFEGAGKYNSSLQISTIDIRYIQGSAGARIAQGDFVLYGLRK